MNFSQVAFVTNIVILVTILTASLLKLTASRVSFGRNSPDNMFFYDKLVTQEGLPIVWNLWSK